VPHLSTELTGFVLRLPSDVTPAPIILNQQIPGMQTFLYQPQWISVQDNLQ